MCILCHPPSAENYYKGPLEPGMLVEYSDDQGKPVAVHRIKAVDRGQFYAIEYDDGGRDLEISVRGERRVLPARDPDGGVTSVEDLHARLREYRSRPFVTERAKATHEKYAHLLPTVFPTGQNKPHICGPDVGDGCCRCEFAPFKRGAIYASWCGHDEIDSSKQVVKILGEIDNDDVPGATWIAALVLASDCPPDVGTMIHFAPNSIKGNTMEECEGVQ